MHSLHCTSSLHYIPVRFSQSAPSHPHPISAIHPVDLAVTQGAWDQGMILPEYRADMAQMHPVVWWREPD